MAKIHVVKDHGEIAHRLIQELRRDPEIIFAYLYGSCAESRPFRDIDVGVFLRDPRQAIQTPVLLAQRLSSALKMPVDVRPLNHAPNSFLYHVFRGTLLISHDDDFLSDLIETTARHYLDIAPLRHRALKEAFS